LERSVSEIVFWRSGADATDVIRESVNERIVTNICSAATRPWKDPMSRSTPRILSASRASTRKSLQSLDYFVSEGCRAFDDLHALTDKLADCGLETNKIHNLQTTLKAGRNYLKIDFKVSLCF